MRIGMSFNMSHGLDSSGSLAEYAKAVRSTERVAHFAREGIRHFELPTDYAGMDHGLIDDEMIASLQQIQERYDVTYSVHLPFRVLDLAYPARSIARAVALHFGEIVRKFERLQPWAYVLHPASSAAGRLLGSWGEQSPLCGQMAATLENSLQVIGETADIPLEKLALENVGVPFSLSERVLARLPVSLCLDQGHIWAGKGGNLAEFALLDGYFHRIIGVHFHDVLLEGGHKQDHLPLGAGSCDYRGFLQELQRRGYSGYLVTELKASDEEAADNARRITSLLL